MKGQVDLSLSNPALYLLDPLLSDAPPAAAARGPKPAVAKGRLEAILASTLEESDEDCLDCARYYLAGSPALRPAAEWRAASE